MDRANSTAWRLSASDSARLSGLLRRAQARRVKSRTRRASSVPPRWTSASCSSGMSLDSRPGRDQGSRPAKAERRQRELSRGALCLRKLGRLDQDAACGRDFAASVQRVAEGQQDLESSLRVARWRSARAQRGRSNTGGPPPRTRAIGMPRPRPGGRTAPPSGPRPDRVPTRRSGGRARRGGFRARRVARPPVRPPRVGGGAAGFRATARRRASRGRDRARSGICPG